MVFMVEQCNGLLIILSKMVYFRRRCFPRECWKFLDNTAYKQWGYNYFFDAASANKQNNGDSFTCDRNDLKYMLKSSVNT